MLVLAKSKKGAEKLFKAELKNLNKDCTADENKIIEITQISLIIEQIIKYDDGFK